MSVALSAGPRADLACDESDTRETRSGWSNVAPLDRSAAGTVGEWLDLLARMSHDMRTPLNAVIGFSDAMQQELFGPIGNTHYEEYVRHIRASGVELLRAAEDALAMTAVLAQSRSRRTDDLVLAPLIESAVEDLAGRGASGRCCIEIVAPPDLEVRSDGRFLPWALRQLICIAAGRAAPGSRILVTARAEHGLVEVSLRIDELACDARPIVVAKDRAGHEPGMGRRDLPDWLAIALLDLLDCRLEVATSGTAMILRTTLEETMQRDFFSTDARRPA